MKRKTIFYTGILLLFVLLQSCLDATESDYERQVRLDDEIIQNYLDTHDREAEKLNSGVYFEVLEENSGGKQVVKDHVVGILYSMIHLEGEYEIETHADTLNPLRFSNSFGANYNAIHPAGLNYSIGEMREGEKFRFYIPSYQAFDNYSHEDFFDEYSNFILEVDLVEVKTEEEIYYEELDAIQDYLSDKEIEAESYPNGLYFIKVEEGEGDSPVNNSSVEFHYTRKYLDGTIIETTLEDDPAQVYMNNNELVEGLEEGLRLMKEGGKAELIMPSRIAFGKSVQVIPSQLRAEWAEDGDIRPLTKPYSPVIYEIDLIGID